jgi:glycosyltransferase involved in cell wall biosynthesis
MLSGNKPRVDRRTAPVAVLDARVVANAGGGPDKTILNSPRFLAASGYRNLCLYLHPPDDPGFDKIRQRANARQAPLIGVPDRGPLDWRVFSEALNVCRRERVRIWHGHDYKTNLLGLLLRPFWPMRLVTTVHGWVDYSNRLPLYYRLDRLCLPRYEKVLCVSEDLYLRCRECGVPARRCELLENGIDLDEYRRQRSTAEAKARLGLTKRFVVGAAGRLSEEKGFDLLIRAADRLTRDGLDLTLLIIGEGPQREALQGLIERLGLSDRVRLLGYRSDLPEWYQAMDVFALSSLREGLPNVLLEAMALEVPVVSTRLDGVRRLVADGDSGLLVEPGSAEQLAAAMGRLLTDEALRGRLARAGCSTIEQRYSFAARMERVRRLYDELLGSRRRLTCTD